MKPTISNAFTFTEKVNVEAGALMVPMEFVTSITSMPVVVNVANKRKIQILSVVITAHIVGPLEMSALAP